MLYIFLKKEILAHKLTFLFFLQIEYRFYEQSSMLSFLSAINTYSISVIGVILISNGLYFIYNNNFKFKSLLKKECENLHKFTRIVNLINFFIVFILIKIILKEFFFFKKK